jgi:hypothetical protein
MEYKIIEGKFKIVDEVCYCGHLQSMHTDGEEKNGIKGYTRHGMCKECLCHQYIWKYWVIDPQYMTENTSK